MPEIEWGPRSDYRPDRRQNWVCSCGIQHLPSLSFCTVCGDPSPRQQHDQEKT